MLKPRQTRIFGMLAALLIALAAFAYHDAREVRSSGTPSFALQLPFSIGETWKFNGVHNDLGCPGNNCTPTDMSAIDFSYAYPFPDWGADTSARWVVAAAPGIARKLSECSVAIYHADGWETQYHHLENIQPFPIGTIAQNERLGVLANTKAEATCEGGTAVGIHVHFSLWRNGVPVALDNLTLSDWTVHSGQHSYDDDCDFMWLARGALKKCVSAPLLNDSAEPSPPTPVSGSTVWDFRQGESGWAPDEDTIARTLTAYGMRYIPSHLSASLTSPTLDLTEGTFTTLYLTMTTTAGTCGRVYFRRADDLDFADERRVDSRPIADNQEHTYIIPLAEHPLWSDEVVQLRLNPACGFSSLVTFTLTQITLQADDSVPIPTPLPTLVPTLPPTLYIPAMLAPAPDESTTDRTPTFRWDTAENAARYHLQLGTTNPPTQIVTNTLWTSYTPPMPLLPEVYYWRVRSLDSFNRPSEWSAVRSVEIISTSAAVPSQNLYTTSTPTLTWNGVPGAVRYRVQVDDNADFSSLAFDLHTLDASVLSMRINPLGNGIYYWRVRAQRQDGSWGSWSSAGKFTIGVP